MSTKFPGVSRAACHASKLAKAVAQETNKTRDCCLTVMGADWGFPSNGSGSKCTVTFRLPGSLYSQRSNGGQKTGGNDCREKRGGASSGGGCAKEPGGVRRCVRGLCCADLWVHRAACARPGYGRGPDGGRFSQGAGESGELRMARRPVCGLAGAHCRQCHRRSIEARRA